MSDVEQRLLAGALLVPGTPVPSSMPVDTVSARTYRHDALGPRPVVRLVGDTVAPGEDQALSFLGFDEPAVAGPLAIARRRGLGFPAWVLVHDPAHAKDALAIVKPMERAVRMARTKPGNAVEQFELLAQQLPVHAHLPSYWEQAGRAFIAAGNNRQAATMFEKARVAERVYALDVDEAERRGVFLEFAFAGALTAKSIASYVGELIERYEPAEAYDAFVELALRRTLGGLPPWSEMPAQLRKLAKAAGLDAKAEDERLLRQLLGVPATALAPAGFWKPYRAALVALGRRDEAMQGVLLNLFPTPAQYDASFHAWWVGLLDDAGALAAVIDPAEDVDAARAPKAGAAAWFDQLLRNSLSSWRAGGPADAVHALLERMAPRLAADGVELTYPSRWGAIDVDLVDHALSLGVPVAAPAGRRADLAAWRAATGPHRHRALEHLTADPRFTDTLRDAIPQFCARGSNTADDLLEASGVTNLVQSYLADTIAGAEGRGFADLVDTLKAVEGTTSRRIFTRFPELHDRFAALDPAAALGRSVRAGLFDELGWDALDEAVAELAPGDQGIRWSTSWPVLVVNDRTKAIAVGPEGRLAEHDLRVAGLHAFAVVAVLWAGGQFLVTWYGDGSQRAYWSGAPDEVFEPRDLGVWANRWNRQTEGLLLPDGGRASGGPALYPGDKRLPGGASIISDGTTCWLLDQDAVPPSWVEIDPVTGARGRISRPAFFEAALDADRPEERPGLAPGGWLAHVPAHSHLLPPDPAFTESPLGWSSEGLGFRVTARYDRPLDADTVSVPARRLPAPVPGTIRDRPVVVGQRTDGRSVTRETDGQERGNRGGRVLPDAPIGLVDLPGGDAPLAISDRGALLTWDPTMAWVVQRLSVGDRAAQSGWELPIERLPAFGTAFVPPLALWHHLRPRDPAGSAALRRLDDAAVQRLLDAAAVDLADQPDRPIASAKSGTVALTAEARPTLAALLQQELPEVTHPRLLEGLLGTFLEGASRVAQLQGAIAARRPDEAAAAGAATAARAAALDDGAVKDLFEGIGRGVQGYKPAGSIGRQIDAMGRFFAGLTNSRGVIDECPGTNVDWTLLFAHAGAVAFLAASPVTPEDQRARAVELLELWAETPMARADERWFLSTATSEKGRSGRTAAGSRIVMIDGITQFSSSSGRQYRVVEHNLDAPDDPPELRDTTVLERGPAVPLGPGGERPFGLPEQIGALATAIAERGPVPWDPAVPVELARRTGLSVPEAALLWAGFPRIEAYGANFLTTAQRTLLGLKAAEVKAARETIRRVPSRDRWALLAAAVPADPAQLWDPLGRGAGGSGGAADDGPVVAAEDSPVARLAAAWVARFGARVEVPADALTAAPVDKARLTAADVLRPYVDPGDASPLAATGPYALAHVDRAVRVAHRGDGPGLTTHVLVGHAVILPWLHATRPAGDPLLAGLPRVLSTLRERLADPDLILDTTGVYLEDEAEREALFATFGTTPYRDGKQDISPSADDGVTIAVRQGWSVSLFLRPARLADDAASRRYRATVAASTWGDGGLAALDLVRSDGYAAIAERVASSPLPAGAHEANPAASAPSTLAAAAAALELDDQAAALFLQLLTLLEPTDRSVRAWNGWTPAAHKRAIAALVERDLVVTAKRERAGRSQFVAGGWGRADAPNLPLETWKLPLYGLHLRDNGKVEGPLFRFVPPRPLHELFEAAWHRWSDGDRPGA